MLLESFDRALISVTISWRVNWRFSRLSAIKILKAVPRPCVCTFPHNLHLSQATQSIMLVVMFWNLLLKSWASLGSCLKSFDSSKCQLKDLFYGAAIRKQLISSLISKRCLLIHQLPNSSQQVLQRILGLGKITTGLPIHLCKQKALTFLQGAQFQQVKEVQVLKVVLVFCSDKERKGQQKWAQRDRVSKGGLTFKAPKELFGIQGKGAILQGIRGAKVNVDRGMQA